MKWYYEIIKIILHIEKFKLILLTVKQYIVMKILRTNNDDVSSEGLLALY